MALAALQALYDDDDDKEDMIDTNITEQETNDRMAVINDPAFSVMSKIKLNLTPAIAIQVRENILISLSCNFSILASRYKQFSRCEDQRSFIQSKI